MASNFYYLFKKNMEETGFSAPADLFGTQEKAVASAMTIMKAIDTFGPRITIGEIVWAGVWSERALAVSATLATLYLGAVIGSLAVATGVSVAGGITRSDIFFTARHFDLDRPWLGTVIAEGQ